jgi:phosphoglycolate phosphatase
MSARLIVFDVDGTLVDSQAHILAAMQAAFDGQGLACPPRERVLSIVGLSLPQAIAQLLPGPDAALHAGLLQTYKDSFTALRAQDASPLYPGARAVLERLLARDDVILGVATGKSRRGLDHVIAAHGLGGYFRTLQVADDHPSKPHPAMLRAALAEAGVRPEDAVMIGDTTYDIDMGRAAGTRTLGVNWGYHPPASLVQAGADRVLEDFEALVPAVDAFWEAA